MTAEELAEFTPEAVGRTKIHLTRSVREALEKANEVSSGDSIFLVTGSLYLVGQIRGVLI